jgi:hypothetical protein
MSHTPTPWSKKETKIEDVYGNIVANFQYAGWKYVNAQANAKRIVECVNACAEFKDPKIDIGLLKLHLEQQNRKLASCEAALAERDVTIQALQDMVKKLEAGLPNKVFIAKENSSDPYSSYYTIEGVFLSEDTARAFRSHGGLEIDEYDLTK